MAIMIPDKIETFCNIQPGEIRTYLYLRDTLPNDHYVLWHLKIKDNKEPDFLVISPDIGLIVLEVKDWLKLTEEELSIKDPKQQSNFYITSINNELKKHAKLLQDSEKYSNNLKFCYANGIIFPNIAQNQLENNEYYNEDKNMFFLKENFSIDNPNRLRERLYLMGENKFTFDKLTEEEIQLILEILIN